MKALYRIVLIGVALRHDLIVSSIDLTRDCPIRVTLKNKGAGGVPDAAYDRKHGLIVQATSNNAGWGGYLLFLKGSRPFSRDADQ